MLSSNNRVSGKQLQKLILLNSLGMGVLFFPRRAALIAGQDSWLIAAGLTVLALIAALLFRLAEKYSGYSGDSFVAGLSRGLPSAAAYLIALLFLVKLILCAGLELRVFSLITKSVLLRGTPAFVTVGAMTAVCAYAAAKGVETRARVSEILWPAVAFVLAVFLIASALDADVSNLKPAFTAPPEVILSGTFRLGYILAPLECLPLAARYAAKKEYGRVYGGVALSGVILTLLTTAAICKFGGRGAAVTDYPVMRLMDLVRLPGSLIERQDAVMFSFWIAAVFAVCNCYLHYGAELLKELTNAARRENTARKGLSHGLAAVLCGAAVFGVSTVPLDQARIELWLDRIYMTSGVFFLFLLPVIVLAAGYLKKSKRRAIPTLLLVLLLLTGCGDGMAVENRAFATAIAIDKASDGENHFDVSLLFPEFEKDAEEQVTVESVSVKSLRETLEKLNARTETQVYLGQAKILLLGCGLLSDKDMLNEAMEAMNSHADINRQMLAFTLTGDGSFASSGSSSGPLNENAAEPELFKKAASFLVKRFKNKSQAEGLTYSLDFLSLYGVLSPDINDADGDKVIPAVSFTEVGGEPKLSGGVMLNDGKLAGVLNEREMRGYLWGVPHHCEGTVVTAEGTPATAGNRAARWNQAVSWHIKKHGVRVSFEENENRLVCVMDVSIAGDGDAIGIRENIGGSNDTGGNSNGNGGASITAVIKDELNETFNKARLCGADIFDLKGQLRKDNYALYNKYAADWDKSLAESLVYFANRISLSENK